MRYPQLTGLTARFTLNLSSTMDLFEEIVRMRKAGLRGALATIVHTNGSIPSYESSRMLVRDDGSIVGTIGGGCVEADVWAAAKEVLAKETPRKMVFQLNNEASYDNGLICGGTLEVFVEPILPQRVAYICGGTHLYGACKIRRCGRIRHCSDRRPRAIRQQRTFPASAGTLHQLRGGLRKNSAQRFFLSDHRYARTSRRHARTGMGGAHRCALRRHDWQQTESFVSLSGARERRPRSGRLFKSFRAHGTGNWRSLARRNRC